MPHVNEYIRTNVKQKKGEVQGGGDTQCLQEKERGWILWMAAVEGGRRGVIKARGVYVWRADHLWSAEGLIFRGKGV